MRARPLVIAAALLGLVAAVPSDAHATGFADTPCPESGPGGLRVCPAATVGKSYAIQLAGSGGCGPALPYQYRVLGGGFPPGLSLSRSGEITGTPTSAGNWSFWIELSDQDPPSASWCTPKKSEREFLISVGVPPATVGTPYAFALGAPGEGSRTWSLASGVLPLGLTLDPASGVIAGTPGEPGSFPLEVAALDSGGGKTVMDFTLTVYRPLSFATVRMPRVLVGHPLRARVRTSGGVGPVVLRVVSGRFPIGVRLQGNLGLVIGRPRKAGVFQFTLEAQDSVARVSTRSFVLVVRRAAARHVRTSSMRPCGPCEAPPIAAV